LELPTSKNKDGFIRLRDFPFHPPMPRWVLSATRKSGTKSGDGLTQHQQAAVRLPQTVIFC